MSNISGPSGCGKSTLLDILADRKDSSNVSGHIRVDGIQRDAKFRHTVGYVVQDDICSGTLTVRENITFSAHLRLSNKIDSCMKNERVSQIIRELDLEACADTRVGSEFLRGVSGGERKRTCIGMELVLLPKILFLDEPTTGNQIKMNGHIEFLYFITYRSRCVDCSQCHQMSQRAIRKKSFVFVEFKHF